MRTRDARTYTRDADGFPELLTAEQAAELLGISAATLNRWGALRDQGEEVGPPCYALSDRVRRWDVIELKQWIRQVRR
jgi:predicted DNA-binding transcriptional regulator AlpA